MSKTRELGLDDYLAILKRRYWWVIVPAILGPVIGYAVSLTLPKRYVSQTLVLVEQQKVADTLVTPVVTEQIAQRLATMKEQILSRSRMEPIIQRFGLYNKEREKVPMDQLVERMRKSVDVTLVKPEGGVGGGPPGFTISVTSDRPKTAQEICTEIASLFMAENLRAREQRAISTTQFLASQVEQAKRDLDDQDSRLAEFKSRHIGQLPGQETMNLNILAGLRTQLDSVNQAIMRAQQDKTYSEALLTQQVSAWESTRTGTNPQNLSEQLATLQAQLVTLESRYTQDHPDVIKTKQSIAALKARIEDNGKAEGANPAISGRKHGPEPPEIQTLRNQIHGYETTIHTSLAEQKRLQEEIRLYQSRIQLSPAVEEKYKTLTRDYETALKFHNDLLSKKAQSEVATSLEQREQGEQFRVVDAPNLPQTPVFPNKSKFVMGGFAAGLALGIGIIVILEAKDKTLKTDEDVEFYLELPTLVMIPSLDEDEIAARNARLSSTEARRKPVRAHV